MLQPAWRDLAVDRVEVVLGNQKSVMLRSDLLASGDLGVVEGCAVFEGDGQKVTERLWTRQPEQFADELGGLPLIVGGNDGVVELDRHRAFQSTTLAGPPPQRRHNSGAVNSRAMLSGSRNSRMYDGPMSLTGSWSMPSSSRYSAAESNSALSAVLNAMWSRPARSSWKRSLAAGRSAISAPPRS